MPRPMKTRTVLHSKQASGPLFRWASRLHGFQDFPKTFPRPPIRCLLAAAACRSARFRFLLPLAGHRGRQLVSHCETDGIAYEAYEGQRLDIFPSLISGGWRACVWDTRNRGRDACAVNNGESRCVIFESCISQHSPYRLHSQPSPTWWHPHTRHSYSPDLRTGLAIQDACHARHSHLPRVQPSSNGR